MTVPSLLTRWKRLQSGLDLSAEAFLTLSKRFKKQTKEWLKADNEAQQARSVHPEAMDIYDTVNEHGMHFSLMLRPSPHSQHIQLHHVQ